MKITVWMNVTSHYQSQFFSAIRSIGIDLRVYYFNRLGENRLSLGWEEIVDLPDEEYYLDHAENVTAIVRATKDRIHIFPACLGQRTVRILLSDLIKHRIKWLIWSEATVPGIRRLLVLPLKRYLGLLINRYGVGALAIGALAHREFLSWGIRPSKIAFLPYSAPLLSELSKLDEVCSEFCLGRRAFLYLGTLSHRKGTDILLRAMAKICETDKLNNWLLLLVGNDSSNEHYRSLAGKLGISDKCLFRGAVTSSDISRILKLGDVFVLPSRFDGWGVVINEAASFGKALISTHKVGAAYHLIENGYNGYIVSAADVHSLSQAMSAYVKNPQLAKIHGKNTRVIYKNFAPERNAQRLNTILNSFLIRTAHSWKT